MEASVRFNNMRQAMRRRKGGRTSYTDLITVEYPEYLHEMFRHATDLLGDNATFKELASAMNLQSATMEDRPSLRMNKFNLLRWFKKNKGIEKRTVHRPILTNEHKIARLQHAELIQNLHRQGKTICYLDEKWFYCFSRRKKQKYLPRAAFEEEGADRMRIRRVVSRSHPAKTMFMGVLTSPIPERNFNGVLALKRISRQEIL